VQKNRGENIAAGGDHRLSPPSFATRSSHLSVASTLSSLSDLPHPLRRLDQPSPCLVMTWPLGKARPKLILLTHLYSSLSSRCWPAQLTHSLSTRYILSNHSSRHITRHVVPETRNSGRSMGSSGGICPHSAGNVHCRRPGRYFRVADHQRRSRPLGAYSLRCPLMTVERDFPVILGWTE